MSVVALLDLTTFAPSEGRAPEPVAPAPIRLVEDEGDEWDCETADETPEALEAMLEAAREADL